MRGYGWGLALLVASLTISIVFWAGVWLVVSHTVGPQLLSWAGWLVQDPAGLVTVGFTGILIRLIWRKKG